MILSKEHREIAKKIAQKSMVLLKMKIFCLLRRKKNRACRPRGPITRYFRAWSWQGKKEEAISLVAGAQKLTTNLLVAQEPFDYFEPTVAAIEEALTLASQADKVVVALGETD